MKIKPHIRFLQYLSLLLISIFFLFPIYWLFIGVFKTSSEHLSRPPIFFIFNIKTALFSLNYALKNIPIPGEQALLNSLVVALLASVISVALGAAAAYSFARFNIGGRNLPFMILTLRIAPPIAAGLPFLVVFRVLGLIDTLQGLIITYVSMNLPLAIWLLRSYFREMGRSYEDAAMVDGANSLQVLWHITLPMAAPAMVATTLLAFIASWNEFFFAILITRIEARTIPTLLPLFVPREMSGLSPWGAAFVLACMSIIPVIILAMSMQRYFVRGLSYGSVD